MRIAGPAIILAVGILVLWWLVKRALSKPDKPPVQRWVVGRNMARGRTYIFIRKSMNTQAIGQISDDDPDYQAKLDRLMDSARQRAFQLNTLDMEDEEYGKL